MPLHLTAERTAWYQPQRPEVMGLNYDLTQHIHVHALAMVHPSASYTTILCLDAEAEPKHMHAFTSRQAKFTHPPTSKKLQVRLLPTLGQNTVSKPKHEQKVFS